MQFQTYFNDFITFFLNWSANSGLIFGLDNSNLTFNHSQYINNKLQQIVSNLSQTIKPYKKYWTTIEFLELM